MAHLKYAGYGSLAGIISKKPENVREEIEEAVFGVSVDESAARNELRGGSRITMLPISREPISELDETFEGDISRYERLEKMRSLSVKTLRVY